MPRRQSPNSVPTTMRTLKTARDTYTITDAGQRAITPEQYAQLNQGLPASLLNRFVKESGDVEIALAAQAPRTGDASQHADKTAMLVSHYHQVLDLGITRGWFQPGARAYYGRDIGATKIPDLSSYDAIQEAAEAIPVGEDAREAAEGENFKPMANPATVEVGDALNEFLGARHAAQTALTNTDTQSEELQALYPEALALAVDICDTVEFYYRKDPDASSRRQKCERWGVVYVFEDGEPQPAPVAPPAPPTP